MHGSKAVTGHANTKGRIGAELWVIFGERAEWALGAVRNDGSDSKTDGYYRIGYKLGGPPSRVRNPIYRWTNRPSLMTCHCISLIGDTLAKSLI